MDGQWTPPHSHEYRLCNTGEDVRGVGQVVTVSLHNQGKWMVSGPHLTLMSTVSVIQVRMSEELARL